MVRRTDLRDSSRARGIGGLDFRAKKRPRNVFYVVVDLFFCWKQRAAAKSCAYLASLFFFALALLSKTQTVFLPIALLLYGWWRDRGSFRREVIRTGPFFVMAAVFGLITIWFQYRGIGEEEIVIGSFLGCLVNAGMALWWYAGLVFLSTRLM